MITLSLNRMLGIGIMASLATVAHGKVVQEETNLKLEATLSYRQGAVVNANQLNQFLNNSCVVEQKAAFTTAEQQILKKQNMDLLTYTRVLILRDRTCFDSLKRAARDMNLDVLIDPRDVQAGIPGFSGKTSLELGNDSASSMNNAPVQKPLASGQPVMTPISSSEVRPDPFLKYQWAFDNKGAGQFQKVDLESRRLYCKPGVENQDIGIKNLPMMSLRKVRVALIDTGVDTEHPDLKNMIARNEPECKAWEKFKACIKDGDGNEVKKLACIKKWFSPNNPEVDQDHNGYPMDCTGWNLQSGSNPTNNPYFEFTKIAGDPIVFDPQGHGTHTAGIMAAEIGNGTGVRGVSNNIEIIPIKVPWDPREPVRIAQVMDPNEKSIQEAIKRMKPRPIARQYYADMIARAFIYAVNAKAEVISMSIGWDQAADSIFLRDVIKQVQARGIIVVAAAGNASTRALMRPCAYDGVICVGSSDNDGSISHFSNYGNGVDILAPGLNILSTKPMYAIDLEQKYLEKIDSPIRMIRFRSTKGYDYFTGTSMSTPFVAGIVAEMLARGVPPSEVYPRLVLGATAPTKPLKMSICVSGQTDYPREPLQNYLDPKKYVLSGNVNIGNSLNSQRTPPQPLLLPLEKERAIIKWDRHASTMKWSFHIKNHWLPIKVSDVKIDMRILKPTPNSIRPQVQSWKIVDGSGDMWATGESRQIDVNLEITDATPYLSRMSGDLELEVNIGYAAATHRHILEAEVIVPLKGTETDPDISVLSFENSVPTGPDITWGYISDNIDGYEGRDYFVYQTITKKIPDQPDDVTWKLWLVKQDAVAKKLGVSAPLEIKAPVLKSKDVFLDQYTYRFDDNKDGKPEYILGFYEDRKNVRSDDPTEKLSPVHFFSIDHNWKVTDSFFYDSQQAPIPSLAVSFVKINGKRRPIWIGPGYDQEKKWTLQDVIENPDKIERPDIRLYYLDDQWKLKSISKPTAFPDYKIVDVLTPSREIAQAGNVQVLMAKNTFGSELVGGYLLDFAVADFENGEIKNFTPLNLFSDSVKYRNLVETSTDQIMSLDYELDVTKGTYWFSSSVTYNQSLALLEPKFTSLAQKALLPADQAYSFSGYDLKPLRDKVDSALTVRSVYSGQKQKGAFVFTTSEIQYHDLLTGDSIGRSIDRYDFVDADIFQSSIRPAVIGDVKLKNKIPALFFQEGMELTPSLKIMLPVYVNGKIEEISAPARLKFKSDQGCRPMDSLILGGTESASFLDYFCTDRELGQRMIRVRLDY